MTITRAGDLNTYLRLEHEVRTATGDRGQPVKAWQTLAGAVPAAVLSLTGKQAEVSRQLVASATHQITIRYRPGVLPGMRLVGTGDQFEGREFVIGHVGEADGKAVWLVLIATAQRTGAGAPS